MGILLTLLSLGMVFIIDSALVFTICWTLGMTFTWKLALAAFLIMRMLQSIFGGIEVFEEDDD